MIKGHLRRSRDFILLVAIRYFHVACVKSAVFFLTFPISSDCDSNREYLDEIVPHSFVSLASLSPCGCFASRVTPALLSDVMISRPVFPR